jgi:hypothetical protein
VAATSARADAVGLSGLLLGLQLSGLLGLSRLLAAAREETRGLVGDLFVDDDVVALGTG